MNSTILLPARLSSEFRSNPLGAVSLHPRLSWELECSDSMRRDVRQTAFQIVVTLDEGEVAWDTGRIASDQSNHVAYAGAPLLSGPGPLARGDIISKVIENCEWPDKHVGEL